MSKPVPAQTVKLLASVIAGEGSLINEVLEALAERFGPIDFISSLLSFDYTDYYTEEMGRGLVRRLVSFESLIHPETLPDVKLFSNQVEGAYTVQGKRRVNIDPGYLGYPHLILATGKGYAHRPYLRDGIYADLTLIYKNGAFEKLPWTYPDYADRSVIRIMDKVRNKYILQKRLKAK